MQRTFEKYIARRETRLLLVYTFFGIKVLALTVLLCLIVSYFLMSSYRVESSSMEPLLQEGDRILATPLTYGAKLPFGAFRVPGYAKPQHGDLVVIVPPYYVQRAFPLSLLEPFRHAFGARGSIARQGGVRELSGFMVKRVIGLPGDTVKMEAFGAYVRRNDDSVFRPEAQLVTREYELDVEFTVKGWVEELPFSGDFAELELAQDEYFVLGDHRAGSSDSRSWGPISYDDIVGKVIFRYWPLRKFGRL